MINIEDTQNLLDQMPGYIGIKDRQSRHIYVSNSTAKLCGFSNFERMIGLTDHELPCRAAALAEIFITQD